MMALYFAAMLAVILGVVVFAPVPLAAQVILGAFTLFVFAGLWRTHRSNEAYWKEYGER